MPTIETATTADQIKDVALRSLRIMEEGSRADFDEVLHPDFLNHEAIAEPPACRRRGPAGGHATALWLRSAYHEPRWEVHHVVAEGDLVVLHCTMSGHHVRDFVTYDEKGQVDQVFAPTGKRFATTQTHWLRIADGKVIEHWANRDDLGTALQLGWVPPTPLYLLRSALAKRRAHRAV